MVNMCFLASKGEFAAGDIHACGTQKLGGRWSRYGVLKACFITLEIERRFADQLESVHKSSLQVFLGPLYF